MVYTAGQSESCEGRNSFTRMGKFYFSHSPGGSRAESLGEIMTDKGMTAWLKDQKLEDVLLTVYMKRQRERYNNLFDRGQKIDRIIDTTAGKELLQLLLVMVAVEDRGLGCMDIPLRLKSEGSRIKSYLIHTSDGGRALPPLADGPTIVERERELVGR